MSTSPLDGKEVEEVDFPEGSTFFDCEGSPYCFVPGEGAFCAFGGTLDARDPGAFNDATSGEPPISRERFIILAGATRDELAAAPTP